MSIKLFNYIIFITLFVISEIFSLFLIWYAGINMLERSVDNACYLAMSIVFSLWLAALPALSRYT